MQLKYTYHAVKEMREELVKDMGAHQVSLMSDEQVKRTINELMAKATFISEIMGENKKVDRLFAYRRYCFILDLHEDVVITIYRREYAAYELLDLVRPLLLEKLANLNEEEEQLENKRIAADMAYLMTQQINASMGGARFENQVREAIARQELKKVTRKLYDFRIEKSKIAKGIALFI